MRWTPLGRALYRIVRKAYYREGRFRVIDELGIPRSIERWRRSHPEEYAQYTARYLYLRNAAHALGRGGMPWVKRFEEKVLGFPRLPRDLEREHRWHLRCVAARDNNPAAKRLMPAVDEDVLPPRWRRKRKRTWVAETPLARVVYEWDIELRTDTSPFLHLHAEDEEGYHPLWVHFFFSIDRESSWLIFDDLEDYERRYRAFLALLNAFVDELRELGERYEATGRFD